MSIPAEYNLHTLANGIRIVHKQVTHTKIAHCGIMLDVGSRDEADNQAGMTHFWEHMAFKGTEKRKAFHIINSLESVGGELNAYTTKEKICFHASLLLPHFEKAVDVLTDITFRSIFPEKEIEKERGVILEEMSMYLDDPEDAIHDDFDEVIFGKHSLGLNILGTEESVKAFQKDDFNSFIKQNIDTSKIIFSSVSALDFKSVIKTAEKYLNQIPTQHSTRKRSSFTGHEIVHTVKNRPISQAHYIFGREAFAINDDKRLPFIMLTNILGGPGMNSKLNLALREKYGYVYGVDASYTAYIDTGVFHIYFSTEKSRLQKSIALVHKELKKMQEITLSSHQLQTYKNQLMGQIAMAEENNCSFMQMMAKSILDLDKIDTLESIFEEINAVSASQLQDLANEMFNVEKYSSLTFLPS